jgi:hypothetical protein
MNFSLKSIASAVVLAVAVSGAHAALDTGATGNGELFLNVWDTNGSYSFDLNKTIDAFQTDIAAAGAINQSYALTNFGSFLAGVADTSLLKFNLLATDTSGARRLLTTFTLPVTTPTKSNDVMRTAALNVTSFAGLVSTAMGANDNVAVIAASTAYAGKVAMGDRIGNNLNFDTFGSLSNSSYTNGLSFMRIDAAATGTALSTYNAYNDANVVAGDGANSTVRVWIDGSNSLHIAAVDGIAAVPEPESYAMLLAGLGMIGLIARRRQNAA